MRRRPILAALAVALVSAACQPAAQQAASDAFSDADAAAIRSQHEAFRQAILAKDFAAAVALFTEDGMLMPPNEPAVQGRAAMQQWLAANFGGVTFTEFTNAPDEIDGRGDIAYSRATFTLAFTAEGMAEPVADTGKFLVTWKKQADGTWLALANPWNSDLPIPGM